MTFTISTFQISDENLSKFKRFVRKPNDCVINALQTLHIIDQRTADLLRIAAGDAGLLREQIQELFSYLYDLYQWRFVRYTNLNTLVDYCTKELPPSRVIFCGYASKADGHVFLIGKDNYRRIVYIDIAHNVVCDLSTRDCFRHIAGAPHYYILQSTAIEFEIQQVVQHLI